MKYDELIKHLRYCGTHDCAGEAEELFGCMAMRSDSDCRNCNSALQLDAADAIEELQQIAGHYEESAHDYFKDVCYYLERMPKWIPVTERLPEKTGKYLVCGQWTGKPAETWVCELIAFGNIKGWANEARNPAVTHWMPLPELPKEKT